MQELPRNIMLRSRLGLATDTEDMTGAVIERAESTVRSYKEQVQEVLEQFLGTISQVPPMYSAVKVDGKRFMSLLVKVRR